MSRHAELPPELAPHVDIGALADWMDANGLGSGPVTAAVPLTGGTQNILIRLTRDGRDYVFRRTPPSPRSISDEVMRREARVLGALAGTDVPHPALIASEPDADVLGYVFLLMEVVDGVNPVDVPPTGDAAHYRRMGFSHVEALSELAGVDVAAVGLSDFGRPGAFLERQVPLWLGHLERYARVETWPGPDSLPGVHGIADWLERHRPEEAAPGLLHGDCHLGNTMLAPGSPEIAALIDWEMSTVGDPRLDLGWVMATWPDEEDTIGMGYPPDAGLASIDELVAHYAARTSRPLDAAPWFGVMACFKLAILLEGTFVRACAGKAPPAVGDRLHAMAVALFNRAQRWAD